MILKKGNVLETDYTSISEQNGDLPNKTHSRVTAPGCGNNGILQRRAQMASGKRCENLGRKEI